jgi:hypothetical protein
MSDDRGEPWVPVGPGSPTSRLSQPFQMKDCSFEQIARAMTTAV